MEFTVREYTLNTDLPASTPICTDMGIEVDDSVSEVHESLISALICTKTEIEVDDSVLEKLESPASAHICTESEEVNDSDTEDIQSPELSPIRTEMEQLKPKITPAASGITKNELLQIYVCNKSNKRFKQHAIVKIHIALCNQTSTAKSFKYKCTVCSFKYSDNRNLKEHCEKIHNIILKSLRNLKTNVEFVECTTCILKLIKKIQEILESTQ